MADQNKKLARDFYELEFNRHEPRESAALYIGDQHIQHNPFVPNGAAPFVEYFEGYFKDHPKPHLVSSHILAKGYLVALHLNSKADEKDRGRSIADIFRIEKDKVVEHWDVAQIVPEKTVSGNTMF